ncbi:MAG: NAAT family transporter, partial [Candidatus Omnitrophica bacterium]|nr:NAAT family transporter [Candidatus Omnitrophota bacterium]
NMNLIDFTILSFASLFVIVDPIGLIPTFLVITEGNSQKERVRTAILASITAFIILMVCAFTGQWVFRIFGVTLPAFEIAGGIVLLLIALDMLQARKTAVKETKEEEAEGIRKEEVAVTPLAVPMLAGPGAITTVVLLASKAAGIHQQLILLGAIFLVCFLTFVVLRIAAVHSYLLGVISMKVIMRLMGLLLATIAIQFILNGIRHANLLGAS